MTGGKNAVNEEMIPALEAEELSVWLKKGKRQIAAVRNLKFTVKKGGCTGIIGESGCGKSLSCQALLGLLEKEKWIIKGTVKLNGVSVPITEDKAMDEFRGSRMALILQNPLSAFDPRMTVGAHFCDGIPKRNKKLREERISEAMSILEKMQMKEPEKILKSYPFQLSGGILQRVLAALSVSQHPEILIADEPTTAMDVITQKEFLYLLKTMQLKNQISILLVSHDIEVISQMVDNIVVMYAGEVVEYGDAQTVLSHPAHPYTAGLFESYPKFSKERLNCMAGYPPALGEQFETGCSFSCRCPQKSATCEREMRMSPSFKEVSQGHFSRCLYGDSRYGTIIGSRKAE